MKNIINRIGKGIAIICLAGMVVTSVRAGVVLAMSSDFDFALMNQPTVLYVNNQLAYTPAYKVQMDDASVMLASKDDAVAMLDLVQKKYNDDDSYSVRLIPDQDASEEQEQYKTAILPRGKKEKQSLASVSFKEDVTVQPANVEVSKVLTVKDAVDKVTKKKNAKLSVVTKEKEVYKEKYNKKVKYVKTDSLYEGQTKVKTKAKKGIRKVDAMVTYTNGKETDREIVEQDVIKEAVAKTVLVGTKEANTFVMPMKNMNLSSPFGSRWGRQHAGVDLTTPIGTPVMASRGGKVTYASWMSGYGYCVFIDHDNGYVTKYAHLNSINVSVGQKVSQGQVIAQSGNTGRSTGPHLHFELIKNGVPVNPMNYIK
jgi:murein DD-endopeptidase MepM/ murein hydrolase activator NlpD